jgi:DNA repair protein RadC
VSRLASTVQLSADRPGGPDGGPPPPTASRAPVWAAPAPTAPAVTAPGVPAPPAPTDAAASPSKPAPRGVRAIPAAERPRERLAARGVAGLTGAELVALVWGSGARGRSVLTLAEEALARHDGLAGLACASELELMALPGVGAAKAAQLAAAFELGRRLLADWPAGRWTVRAPRDVAERLVPSMGHLEREELRVVLLNAKNAVLKVVTVYQGSVSSSLVRVGELYRDAVRLSAAGIILAHNHPSGDPTPSPDDLHLTAEALAAGRLLDVELLDHLVIGHDAFVSLRDRGVVFDRPGPGRRAAAAE